MLRSYARARSLLLLGLAACSPFALSCDQLVQQLEAKDFAVAVLLATPSVPNPKNPSAMLSGAATLSVFVGATDVTKISGNKPSADAISPESDATVSIEFTPKSGTTPISVSVPSKGSGVYAVTSKESMLTLEDGTAYTVTIARAGQTYVLTGTSLATPPKIKEFEDPSPKVIPNYDYVARNGFTVTRDPTKDDTNLNPVAFVAMQAIDSNTTASSTPASSGLTYSNVPTTPLGFLELVLDKSKWQANTFPIPVEKFAAATPYLITMTGVSDGKNPITNGSSALFAGSTFLIGTADAGGVVTK
jgi:hypothetical protein